MKKPAYPDNKKLVVDETNNMVEKLTTEYAVSPAYSCIQIGAYCFAQIAAIYTNQGKKIPKDLEKFLNTTYPKLLSEHTGLINEQYIMLNTEGTA